MTTTSPTYILGASQSELDRLLFQSSLFREEAARLLDRCGVESGHRAIDIGCGPLGILDLLSHRVGPTGHVVGVDNESRMLELAERTIAERELANVRLALADAARTGYAPDSFDLAHTRLVLMNVPHSDRILDEMISLVRPGGVVAVEDVDWITRTCVPAHPSWDRLVSAIAELWRRKGMDVHLGRKLPIMLGQRGLLDVGVNASVKVFHHGEPYHTLMVGRAEQCREALVGHGLLTEEEFAADHAALCEHLDRPDTIVVHATMFQAWGTVPDR
jgi:SAM-dependent methyltransferase